MEQLVRSQRKRRGNAEARGREADAGDRTPDRPQRVRSDSGRRQGGNQMVETLRGQRQRRARREEQGREQDAGHRGPSTSPASKAARRVYGAIAGKTKDRAGSASTARRAWRRTSWIRGGGGSPVEQVANHLGGNGGKGGNGGGASRHPSCPVFSPEEELSAHQSGWGQHSRGRNF